MTHPPVAGILIRIGSGYALIDQKDVLLNQNEIRLRSAKRIVSTPVWRIGMSRWRATC